MKIFFFVLTFFSSLAFSHAESEKAVQKTNIKTAIFAGGCFWCMQPPYDALNDKGVISTSVGYSGGRTANPTYEQVSNESTGHYEVIQVTYDSNKISYKDLLSVFWKNIDPFDDKGQFCDKGESYKSAVFYSNAEEKKEIESSIQDLEKKGIKTTKFATKILPATTFYKGEEYHQAYYKKNAVKYKYYRYRCGRDQRLKEVWGASK
jgi:peptide-methionine (S)-S-oxide reductase